MSECVTGPCEERIKLGTLSPHTWYRVSLCRAYFVYAIWIPLLFSFFHMSALVYCKWPRIKMFNFWVFYLISQKVSKTLYRAVKTPRIKMFNFWVFYLISEKVSKTLYRAVKALFIWHCATVRKENCSTNLGFVLCPLHVCLLWFANRCSCMDILGHMGWAHRIWWGIRAPAVSTSSPVRSRIWRREVARNTTAPVWGLGNSHIISCCAGAWVSMPCILEIKWPFATFFHSCYTGRETELVEVGA
jgi:hypothetical protein